MNPELSAYINELYAKGRTFDEAEPIWERRWRNIDPPVGEFLWILLRAMEAKSVLEIGTSNGYSTIWMADAVRSNGGKIVSVDHDSDLINLAKSNVDGARLGDVVELRHCEAGDILKELPDETVDFLFLDSERSEYSKWWPHPKRVLRSGGVLVVDNMVSHPQEIADLYDLIQGDKDFFSTVVPVGKGELVALKS